jgi:hypothetical protein
MVNNLLRCLPVLLPVVITARTPNDLTVTSGRRGKGGFSLPAVLKILGCSL